MTKWLITIDHQADGTAEHYETTDHDVVKRLVASYLADPEGQEIRIVSAAA